MYKRIPATEYEIEGDEKEYNSHYTFSRKFIVTDLAFEYLWYISVCFQW